MAFKRQPVNVEQKDDYFISSARGETSNVVIKPQLKAVNVPLPLETIQRLKHYQATEAKKKETQSYIFNEALNIWLDSKKFD